MFIPEFSVSPQGSLDLTIEEDCITAADSEFSQNQQKMVSQSLPNTTRAEGYARSFSAAEVIENEHQVVYISISMNLLFIIVQDEYMQLCLHYSGKHQPRF